MKTLIAQFALLWVVMIGIPLEEWGMLDYTGKKEVMRRVIEQIRKEVPCGKDAVL